MVVRRTSRSRSTSRVPRWYWIAGLLAVLVLAGGSAVVWRGCSRRGPDPYAAWGGMTKEEFLKKRKQREEEEAKQQAEAAKRAEEEKKKKEEEAAAKKAAEKQQQSEANGQPEQKVAKSNTDSSDESATTTSASELPPVPEEFTSWKDFDYFVARLTNHPQLPRAVEHRLNNTPRDERQAEFFEKLLVLDLPPGLKKFVGTRAAEEEGRGGDRETASAAVEAITEALSRNGTAEARRTLTGLLAGTVSAGKESAAPAAALRALAVNPTAENERLLALAVFEPEKIIAWGGRETAPEKLREQAVAALAEHGKSGVRLLAAKRFVEPSCPAQAKKLLAQVWLRPHPENLEAYVFLIERPELDAQVRSQALNRLTELSGWAMRQFLGIADVDASAQVSALGTLDPEFPYRVAQQLWKADLARAIDARRTTVRSMEEAREWVLLAATVPRADVRSRLGRLLERRWEEGPPVASSSGANGQEGLVVEPGILAVLKNARRNRPTANQAAAKTRNTGQRLSPQAKDPWLDFEQAIVHDLCRRLAAAAVLPNRAKESDKATADDSGESSGMPIPLHPRAEIDVQYVVRWPGDHAAKLASLAPDPLEVAYVRIEQRARPMNVRGHYERTLKGPKMHPTKEGVWLETLLPGKNGAVRSVDVLLSRANPKVDAPPDEMQEITVEILSVTVTGMEAATRRAGTSESTDEIP